jgi:hypothetical protein
MSDFTGREGAGAGLAITYPRVAQPSQLTAGDSLLLSQSH